MFNFTVKTHVLTLLSACLLGLSVSCGWWVAGVITAATVGYASWTARQRSRAQQREAEARAHQGWACTDEVAALVETLSRRAPELFTPAEQENIRRWSAQIKTAAKVTACGWQISTGPEHARKRRFPPQGRGV